MEYDKSRLTAEQLVFKVYHYNLSRDSHIVFVVTGGITVTEDPEAFTEGTTQQTTSNEVIINTVTATPTVDVFTATPTPTDVVIVTGQPTFTTDLVTATDPSVTFTTDGNFRTDDPVTTFSGSFTTPSALFTTNDFRSTGPKFTTDGFITTRFTPQTTKDPRCTDPSDPFQHGTPYPKYEKGDWKRIAAGVKIYPATRASWRKWLPCASDEIRDGIAAKYGGYQEDVTSAAPVKAVASLAQTTVPVQVTETTASSGEKTTIKRRGRKNNKKKRYSGKRKTRGGKKRNNHPKRKLRKTRFVIRVNVLPIHHQDGSIFFDHTPRIPYHETPNES